MHTRVIAQDVLSRRSVAIVFNGEGYDLVPTSEEPSGLFISPGWMDLQVNGFGGLDINAPILRADDVRAITARLWQEGVTAWCPTLISAPYEQVKTSLAVLAQACEMDDQVRSCVAGIHLEGPYISPLEGARGAHAAQFIRPPDWEEFTRWQDAAGGRIRIVTLAPEQPGAIEMIQRLAHSGVLAALGHTHASTADIHRAVTAGARLSTHLGNGIEAYLPRHPNPIWDQLAEDRLAASLIFDGFHLPSQVMKVMLRSKGIDGCLLISDATSLAGMPPGRYETTVGGSVELRPDGRLSLAGTDYLAGSASSLKSGVENAIRWAGVTLSEAVRLAAVNPARLLSFDQNAMTLFALDSSSGQITTWAAGLNGRAVYRNPMTPVGG